MIECSVFNNVFQIGLVDWLCWFNVMTLLCKSCVCFVVMGNLSNSCVGLIKLIDQNKLC